jgi:tetratricopeptide (TPR) repeat protein
MVSRKFLYVFAAGLGSVLALAQGATLMDATKSPAPSPPQTPTAGVLSPETRGDIFMARKMYREAIEAFSEGSPKDAVLRNKTGIAYHQLQQFDKAKKNYDAAVKLRPQYAEAHNNIGTIYYAAKSYRRAVNAYKKALQLSPGSASIHMNLGTAYFARGLEKDAMEEYQKAMALDPDVFERHGTYGVLLEERSVEDRAKYHYALAKLYANSSRPDLVLQYLRKALEEGFKDKKKMEQEPAFAALRESPEFQALLALEPRVL